MNKSCQGLYRCVVNFSTHLCFHFAWVVVQICFFHRTCTPNVEDYVSLDQEIVGLIIYFLVIMFKLIFLINRWKLITNVVLRVTGCFKPLFFALTPNIDICHIAHGNNLMWYGYTY